MRPFRPLAPPPWGSRNNLPTQMRSIPFVAVRPHELTRYPSAYVAALQYESRFPPMGRDTIFVPAARPGTRKHPIAAARVIAAAREQAERMAAAGRAGQVPRFRLPPAPYPATNPQMFHGQVPGYGIPDVPFDPRGHLPMAAQIERQRLQQMPQTQGYVAPHTAMDERVRRIADAWMGDPISGRGF